MGRLRFWGYWSEDIKKAEEGIDFEFKEGSEGGKMLYNDGQGTPFFLVRHATKEELNKILVDEL